MKPKLPTVAINMAITADGKIATHNRKDSSFGSKRDHTRLLELRAEADAVMAGARTVDSNPVTLGPGGIHFRRLRLKHGLAEYNLRVVVSGTGSLNPDSAIFRSSTGKILIITSARAPQKQIERLRSCSAGLFVSKTPQINFTEALAWLAGEWKVRTLLCEGGGELNDALFREHLVDRVNLTICPFLFGGRAAPTIADGAGFAQLKLAARFRVEKFTHHTDELFLTLARRAKRTSATPPPSVRRP